ncbi:hypothetical protein FBR02_01760 [Anaerolineae bacterium CFX9]|nr:hypothetical protein [Anaerolineae bacterium CFX9]
MRSFARFTALLIILAATFFIGVLSVLAVASATITTIDDYEYAVTGTGLTDEYSGCDLVTVMVADATGGITDVDTICLDILTGYASDYADWGSHESGYYPTQNPLTYTLFDTDTSSPCFSEENSYACSDFLLSGAAVCLAETYRDVDLEGPFPTSLGAVTAQFSACNSPAEPGSPVTTCRLPIPDGSVVGEAPLGAQIYYEPGNIAPGYVANPGTYIVIGQDESETYYQIVLACQLVWVRKDTMQPSFLPPQNGTPLPTRIVG